MRIVSVNVGAVRTIDIGGRPTPTGIFKRPVTGPVMANTAGLAGDGRGSPRSAGDHAICVYPRVHYDHWEQELGRALPLGIFGENLTVEGGLEQHLRIGDVLAGPEVRVQVAQPRTPCKKLNVVLATRFSGAFLESGRTGYYLRVLTEGRISPGESWRLERTDRAAPTVYEFVQHCMNQYWDEDQLRWLRQAPGLPSAWLEAIDGKLVRAQRAVGWAGLRELVVIERQLRGDAVALRLRCARGKPLPPLGPGQSIALALRTQLGEAHERPRSLPWAPSGEPEADGDYRVLFDELPASIDAGSTLRVSAPAPGRPLISRDDVISP